MMEDSRSRRIVEVTEYWPEVSEDLSLVTWSHATNSQAEVGVFYPRKYLMETIALQLAAAEECMGTLARQINVLARAGLP